MVTHNFVKLAEMHLLSIMQTTFSCDPVFCFRRMDDSEFHRNSLALFTTNFKLSVTMTVRGRNDIFNQLQCLVNAVNPTLERVLDIWPPFRPKVTLTPKAKYQRALSPH